MGFPFKLQALKPIQPHTNEPLDEFVRRWVGVDASGYGQVAHSFCLQSTSSRA